MEEGAGAGAGAGAGVGSEGTGVGSDADALGVSGLVASEVIFELFVFEI